MKLSLIDTDIFSLFLRHHRQVEENFQAYSQEYQKITLSIINYYEVLAGLRHKDARDNWNTSNRLREIILSYH